MKRRVLGVMGIALATVACSSDPGGEDDSDSETFAWPDTWESVASMPTPRKGQGCSVVGREIVAIAGLGLTPTDYRTDLERYDLTTDTWRDGQDLPVARDYFATVTEADRVWVIGGFSAGQPEAMFAWDAASDTWSVPVTLPNRVMPVGGLVGDTLVLAGGSLDWQSLTSSVVRIDPATGGVTTGAAMPTASAWAASAVADGKLWVAGGSSAVFGTASFASLYAYDPAADAWTEHAPMPAPRSAHALVPLRGALYAIGGYGATSEATDTVWRYDIAGDVWVEATPLPEPAAELCAVTADDVIHVIGGHGADRVAHGKHRVFVAR